MTAPESTPTETRIICARCGQPVETLAGHFPTCPTPTEREAGGVGEVAAVLAAHQRVLDGAGSCRCGSWPPAEHDVAWPDHLAAELAPLMSERERAAGARALLSAQRRLEAATASRCAGCDSCDGSGYAAMKDASAIVGAMSPAARVDPSP